MLTLFAALSVLQGDPAIEMRVEAALAKMTLPEKIDLIGGVDGFYVREVPEAGLPRLKMSDGPVGVRNDGPTTAYPAGFTLAATWDPELANRFGVAIGRDARARGVHIWLGPGVNLARTVQNGRNFEYLGEDPLLSGRTATEIVKGVQSQGVVATVKHYAGNEHENDRNNDDSIIDERTLRELYIKPFEMVVKDGKPGALMTSYNLVNGTHASENGHLINDILKGEWGFKGIVMSDWVSTYSPDGPYKNGLDLEMPSARMMNREKLQPLIDSGTLSTSILDDKVRRILRVALTMGWDKRPQKDSSIPLDDRKNAEAAMQVAREGIVLLKNKGGVLPLKADKQRILVVGPNAEPAVTGGGGSAYTTPNQSVSVKQALELLAPKGTTVEYRAGVASVDQAVRQTVFDAPLKVENFTNKDLQGEPSQVRTATGINFSRGGGRQNYSTRYTGQYTPKESGTYTLVIRVDDGMRVFLDDKKVFDEWHDQAETNYTVPVTFTAGKPMKVVVEYYQGTGAAVAKFGISKDYGASLEKELPTDLLKSVDAVVACVGFNNSNESEGGDRPWDLPKEQVAMLQRLVSLNKKVIVILNAGAGVATESWICGAAGFIHSGYPGGEGNLALVEILYGKTSPSGKLPTSFPAKIEGTYYASAYPSVGRKMVYKEGPFIGYRWFDANKVAPLYPFGFGLSYSSFALSKPTLQAGNVVRVAVTVKNTGKVPAAETVQLYAEPPKGSVPRAPRELRAFKRVQLAPGESQQVVLAFPWDDLAWYSVDAHKWVTDKGSYKLRIGTSSRDLPITLPLVVQ